VLVATKAEQRVCLADWGASRGAILEGLVCFEGIGTNQGVVVELDDDAIRKNPQDLVALAATQCGPLMGRNGTDLGEAA
jgi:hypothetical protein